ncbi:MAG: LysM peptidoglycan-binding domain-containing protein [Mariprofundus sp.]|nr:LysM peptidoglycan-binding domain-containing protein [Mariprofundus sp.]
MTFKHLGLPILIASLFLFAPSLFAGQLQADGGMNNSNVKADLPQPYVVKKGDTLWDIADYFFKDPWKWLKIWEHNLYITNPDLIYPGNKIWFDGRQPSQGGLTRIQLQPQVIILPVERMEEKADSSMLLTALQRQGFIQPDQVQGVGYILDSRDDRLNYGEHDRVYLKLNQSAKPGSLFDVFRSTDVLREPNSGNELGVLIKHMGQVKVLSAENGVSRAVVVKAFEEISRGDRVKPARMIDPHIVLGYPDSSLSGTVIYIRNDAHEAGQHQVLGINLGLKDGLKAGMQMSIFKAGRVVKDKVAGGEVLLPQEQVGKLLILVPQQRASIALITKSTGPINVGDAVKHSLPQ